MRKLYEDYAILNKIPLIFFDDLDNAIIGLADDGGVIKVVYSEEKCINLFMLDDEIDYDDAAEYFFYNVAGCYAGKHSPLFCEDAIPKEMKLVDASLSGTAR